jgi:hypothetical protein
MNNNKVQELLKNVISENALKVKEQTGKILYSKVSDRLKQQYVTVSKNLFKNINEMYVGGADVMQTERELASNAAELPDAYNAAASSGTGQPPKNPSKGQIYTHTDGNTYIWDGKQWVLSGHIPGDIPDWEAPGKGQNTKPPNPNDYYPGGFGQGTPKVDPNNPSRNSPPDRSKFPKGPDGDKQHQEAAEEYRRRWEAYQRDVKEYKEWYKKTYQPEKSPWDSGSGGKPGGSRGGKGRGGSGQGAPTGPER